MNKPIFEGSAVAIVTPFTSEGGVNFKKLEQLVEQTIRLRSMRDDVDTSFVTDFIESMDAVLESDDLTYDAYAAKYARAAAAATGAADAPAAIGEHAAAASAATAPAAAPAEEEGDDD